MQSRRTGDTAPEFAVRRFLHARGLHYRIDRAPLPGVRRRADVVFGPERLAVFVEGRFWHGLPLHGTEPRTNGDDWRSKFRRNRERNRERDTETDRLLSEAGWPVLRAREQEAPADIAARVEQAVARLRQFRGQELPA